MEKIEIATPEPEKALPVLREAIERHERLLAQSIARTHEQIQHLNQTTRDSYTTLTACDFIARR